MGKGLRAGFQNARQTLGRAIKVSKKDVAKEPAIARSLDAICANIVASWGQENGAETDPTAAL